jgi:hypothetical protein
VAQPPRQSKDTGNVIRFPVVPLADAERDVERVNQYPLYTLGKTLRRLIDVIGPEQTSARELYYPLRNSIDALDRLLSGVPFPLGISRSAAQELRSELQSIANTSFATKDKSGRIVIRAPDSSIMVDSWETGSILHLLTKFETIFSTEMGELATYFVPQRGIYSTAALIDFADQSFPIEVIGHIPEKSKLDWKAAGRCLAFNLLTATGFHVARAVEATLEAYYQLFTGKSDTLNGWHNYIQALQGVIDSNATPSPAEKTLAELRQMKDDYRNPVMHPRVVLNESDARMLFDNGESLIIAMAQEIKAVREEAGGVQGSLAVVGGSPLDDDLPF